MTQICLSLYRGITCFIVVVKFIRFIFLRTHECVRCGMLDPSVKENQKVSECFTLTHTSEQKPAYSGKLSRINKDIYCSESKIYKQTFGPKSLTKTRLRYDIRDILSA